MAREHQHLRFAAGAIASDIPAKDTGPIRSSQTTSTHPASARQVPAQQKKRLSGAWDVCRAFELVMD
jgi:hypothetical protein